MKNLQRNKSGFTLIEIVLAMTVFAMIMTSVLLSVESLAITRVKTENRVKLLEELYFFSEQLVTNIKDGGTVDYEEYWNRESTNTIVQSWSYRDPTGVGNYGSGWILWTSTYGAWLYYCVSGNGLPNKIISGSGCLTEKNNPTIASGGIPWDYSGKYQRYGQYLLQFTDYNSNFNNDSGDEDGIGGILGDEDDKDIWNGPIVLSGSTPELYLINPVEKTRVYFRHIIRQDPNAYSGWSLMACQIYSTGANIGCMGNIQVLKMRWEDYWYTHTGTATDGSAYDGKIDTWLLHPQWSWTWPIVAGGTMATGYKNEWVDLFPNTVNIKSLKFYIFPKKDPWLSWDAADCAIWDTSCISPFIHPYVRIQMTVGFSWGKRRILRNEDPTISINTTISLGDRE